MQRTESEKSIVFSQVEDHCRQRRNVQRVVSTRDANRVHKARYLSCAYHDDGSASISIQRSRESGELVMKAIENAMSCTDDEQYDELQEALEQERVDCDKGFENNHSSIQSRRNNASDRMAKGEDIFRKQADAMVRVAQEFLGGGSVSGEALADSPSTVKTICTADHYQIIVHVDEPAFFTEEGHESGKRQLSVQALNRKREERKHWQKENNTGHNLASTGGSISDANPGSVLSANQHAHL